MNKKIIITVIITIFLGNLFAQSETRELENFSFLKVKNALEVVLTQGEVNSATITGLDPEDFTKVQTEVVNGELAIFTNGKIKSKNDLKVLLTFKELRGISQSGSSEISSAGPIRADKFSIKGSGAIEADLKIEVNQLNINLTGASDIKLSGMVNDFDLTLSGASDLKASELIAKNIKVYISGASDVKVYASESISGRASGASSISVKGNPSIRDIQTSVATSTSFHDLENVSINVGNNQVDVKGEDVNVNVGKRGVNVSEDTTQIKWGNTKFVLIDDSLHISKVEKKRRNHWAGVDIGINGFMDGGNSLDLSNPAYFETSNPKKVTQFMELDYSKSWFVSVNFMEFFIKIKEHHFGLVTGLGTEWNNYELKHNVYLDPKGGNHIYSNANEYTEDYTWGEVDTVLNYSKNRFKTWFINAPLLLEVNTGNHKNKSFHISAGAILGMNLQTKMKYKYSIDGNDFKDKDKDSFNTNPFRVSLTTRVGYGWFNVFATYSLTPLFENNRGPELYPFTVGVTLLGF